MSYWARTEIKDSQKKSKKLKDIYIDRIKRWAKNQVTSKRSSRKIDLSRVDQHAKKEKFYAQKKMLELQVPISLQRELSQNTMLLLP